MPIYKVAVTAVEAAPDPTAAPLAQVKQVRLVRAPNHARAVSHVVKKSVTAEVCSVEDALTLGAEGVKVEEAE